MLKFTIEAIITFVKNLIKDINWYVHFIGKPIIKATKYLPRKFLGVYKNGLNHGFQIYCLIINPFFKVI